MASLLAQHICSHLSFIASTMGSGILGTLSLNQNGNKNMHRFSCLTFCMIFTQISHLSDVGLNHARIAAVCSLHEIVDLY